MSAHAGRPDDLVEWARRRTADVTPASFLPRSLYGTTLRTPRHRPAPRSPASRAGWSRWSRPPERPPPISCSPAAAGWSSMLWCWRPATCLRVHRASAVPTSSAATAMSATPGAPGGSRRWTARCCCSEPVSPPSTWPCGSTISGFEGTIHAVSRHGLLPRRHLANPPLPSTAPSPAASETTVRGILAKLRGANREGDWRVAVDQLRPQLGEIWQRLPDAERRRFLRHAARLWEVHRHRLAPRVAAADRLPDGGRTSRDPRRGHRGLPRGRERARGGGARSRTGFRAANAHGEPDGQLHRDPSSAWRWR